MMMVISLTRLCRVPIKFNPRFYHVSLNDSVTIAVKDAVEAKTYRNIPDILVSTSCNQNPFLFLSTYPDSHRTQIVDEMLQSFLPIRPRSRAKAAYDHLITYTLQNPHPLPLSLAILQRMLRSGCLLAPQVHLLLSSAWLDRRHQSQSVSGILLEMQDIGYDPDSVTCNYLISSLSAVDHLDEAVNVLKSISKIGCIPNLESYGAVINAMCRVRRTGDSVELMKQMVKEGLSLRQRTVVKVIATLRDHREIRKAVDMIEFLEKSGYSVGFESYESAVEGCLECSDYLLAAKVVMAMTEKGFIPYIKVRLKVIQGLAGIGESKLASSMRQRFVELGS